MRIVARRTLREFIASLEGRKDQQAVWESLERWRSVIEAASWTSMADVKAELRTASVIDGERVVFNIKGNSFRLVVAMDFEGGRVFIKWIGSHEDYDRIDVRTVRHER